MTRLHWIEDGATDFPDSRRALKEPNGLLAIGGDLSGTQLLAAYRRGIFPWFDAGQPVLWWSPDPRLVLFPNQLHVSRSMEKLLRKKRFGVTTDRNFDAVIRACATIRAGREATWITPAIISAYRRLHEQGFAHSVEVIDGEQLVGGLYGVALGRVFFGESMFSEAGNASKYGFICLMQALEALGYRMIDCQVRTAHLLSLGAQEIPRRKFERYLLDYEVDIEQPPPWPTTVIGQQRGADPLDELSDE